MAFHLIAHLVEMRKFYQSGATRSYQFRKQQLLALKKAVQKNEALIYEALYQDLKKSKEESWVTENGFLIAEINDALANLHLWMAPKKVSTNLLNLPSSSRIEAEPLGVALIIGPWNYPLQLSLTPLLGSIAAGNCTLVKPSEFAPATAGLVEKIIQETFDPTFVCCVNGDGASTVTEAMTHFVFDHVFYTGSTAVGKLIYKMAAENLVPVTLELGGKSPCVVEADANIEVAAKRIVVTKFSNAGQMCVAPDYVLVHQSKKEELVLAMKKRILAFFGDDPALSENYGRIINQKQFDRLVTYLNQGTVLHGGKLDAANLFIAPTLIEGVDLEDSIMKEEIFGPILPVISFQSHEEALAIMAKNPNPLAFYIFTANKQHEQFWLSSVAAGGACVNNCSWHLTNPLLPFGGRGFSGTGAYHGKASFDAFSHYKSVLKTPTWFDPSLKYPPFKGKLGLFKWFIK